MAHSVHDALVKATFSQVEHAAGELRLALPAALAARIDFTALKLCPGSFIDEALSARYTDLLFSAPLSGRPAYLYLLFEHKSGPEALTAFQLLRYMVRIWEEHLKNKPKAQRLPAIVPVVLHHGEGGWTVARSFEELLDVDADTLMDLGVHVPRFQFLLDDLDRETDEALHRRAMTALGRLTLWCLRHAWTPEQIVKGMGRWLDLVAEVRRGPKGVAALATLWRYVLLVGHKFGPKDLSARLVAAVGQEGKEEIVTAGEQLIEQGRLKGLLEGRREGQRTTLLKLLRARFGELPATVLARVNAAELTELDLWTERILTAPTLSGVLGGI